MSIAEFFSMGGYGLYVWSSFGTTLLLISAEVVIVKQQHRTILQRLSRMLRMQAEVKE